MKKNFQSHSHLLLDDQKQSVLTQRNVAALLEVYLLRNRSGELKKIKKIIAPTGLVFNRMKIFVNLKSIQLLFYLFRIMDHLCLFLRQIVMDGT